MKKTIIYTKIFVLSLFLLLVTSQSCTDLDEEVFGAVLAEDFLTTEEEFTSALGSAYTSFNNFIGEPWSLAEVASDEVIVPTRGADWFDNGNWQRLHLHTYQPGDDRVTNTWPELFRGVNNSNRLIFQFGNLPEENQAVAQAFISELKALRALFYYYLLDIYGNVPIVTDFTQTDPPFNNADFQAGRTEVFNFTVNEVESGIDDLTTDIDFAYGRMHFYAAHALLAKLYLNSGVYLGTGDPTPENLQKAINSLDVIINSGLYSLETDYFANFATDNEDSEENIYVIVYDNVFAPGMNVAQRTLHYQSQETFDLDEQPWNGYASLQEFYNSFVDPAENPGPVDDEGLVLDARRGNFIVGPQFTEPGGEIPITDPSVEDFDPDGPPVIFTPEINELGPNALRQAGARIGKYEFAPVNQNQSNDYPVFRYADILLMKAEALWRLGDTGGESLALVNQVRERAGVEPFTQLTADNLLAERGREMAFEFYRRQDLLRFPGVNGGETRYNDPWEFKSVSPPFINVFPIPTAQLQANDNLIQNPGY